MRWLHQIAMKAKMLFGRERAGTRLDDELHYHLEKQIAENVAAGMNPQQARMLPAWRASRIDPMQALRTE